METAQHPQSNSFVTRADRYGKNRIIIDTNDTPWNYQIQSETIVIVNGEIMTAPYISVATMVTLISVAARLEIESLENTTFITLFNRIYGDFVMALLDGQDTDITEDMSVVVLWQHVRLVERVLSVFLKLWYLVYELDNLDRQARFLLQTYIPLYKYIARHTSGTVHIFAKKMIESYDPAPIPLVSMPRGWKCGICCESKNSHSCFTLSCSHVFHYACLQKIEFPECPLCRTLIDFE